MTVTNFGLNRCFLSYTLISNYIFIPYSALLVARGGNYFSIQTNRCHKFTWGSYFPKLFINVNPNIIIFILLKVIERGFTFLKNGSYFWKRGFTKSRLGFCL